MTETKRLTLPQPIDLLEERHSETIMAALGQLKPGVVMMSGDNPHLPKMPERPSLLDFFRKNTPSSADEQRMEALVRQLGDDDFAAREKASTELVAIGIRVAPLLRRAVKDNDPEISTRAKTAL